MSGGARKLLLTIHIAASVGWVGAVLAYLPLDVATAMDGDAGTLRAAYVGMDIIARWIIAPLAVGALVTGVAIALATPWGLFRHYWVVLSLILTIVSVLVLFVELQTIAALRTAAHLAVNDDAVRALPSTLPHSLGGLIVISFVLVLNMYKPRGLTRYGWRRQLRSHEEESRLRTER